MNRYFAVGYAMTVAAIAADLVVLNGAAPSLSGATTLLIGQTILLALIPAAVLLFIGARQSTSRIHKFFGYSFFALDVLLAISACVAIVLIASGQKPA